MIRDVLTASHPWPLHGTSASRAIEARALAAVPPHTLMRRAGLAVARLAIAVAPHARRVWVVAGPGNNGGDGLEAALHLHRAGCAVEVSLLADPARQGADARDATQRAREAGVHLHPGLPPSAPAADLVIDALLGLGTQRPAEGELARAMALVNALERPCVSVDLPSALNGDTGQPVGAACVRAHHTLSLLTLKPGLFTGSGRDLAGRVWFDDLDASAASADASAHPTAWLDPARCAMTDRGLRRHAQHKGSFGDVVVVGGASGMAGAADLAASAALAAGGGRVYRVALDPQARFADSARPELMHRLLDWARDAAVLGRSTVVCGCGGGDAVAALLPAVLASAARLVLDADALNAVAADPALRAALAQRTAPTVITPHPLEAARLLGCDAATVQADRVVAAQALADRLNAVVVLKGSGSVVAAPGSVPRLNGTGNAALGTAGSGDVLAGWIGGAWAAQPAAEPGELQLHVAAVVRRHGAAADAAVPGADHPLRAADLIEVMWRA